MSLAPVVLCLTLFAIASYLFAGQFATNSAITLLDQASAELHDETASLALFSIAKPSRNNESAAEPLPANPLPISVAMLKGDTFQQPTPNSAPDNPFYGQPLPSWLTNGYHGIVALQGKLYLCAFVVVPQAGRTLSILGTRPLDKSTLRDERQQARSHPRAPRLHGQKRQQEQTRHHRRRRRRHKHHIGDSKVDVPNATKPARKSSSTSTSAHFLPALTSSILPSSSALR